MHVLLAVTSKESDSIFSMLEEELQLSALEISAALVMVALAAVVDVLMFAFAAARRRRIASFDRCLASTATTLSDGQTSSSYPTGDINIWLSVAAGLDLSALACYTIFIHLLQRRLDFSSSSILGGDGVIVSSAAASFMLLLLSPWIVGMNVLALHYHQEILSLLRRWTDHLRS